MLEWYVYVISGACGLGIYFAGYFMGIKDERRRECVPCQHVRGMIRGWVRKRGNDRCWYYPDIFASVAKEVGLDIPTLEAMATIPVKQILSREEFEKGCRLYQDEEYKRKGVSQ